MITLTIASIILVGISLGYSALARASARLALAQGGLVDHSAPRCRPGPEATAPGAGTRPKPRYRCDLPERCEFDTISQSCRTTTSPSA